MAARTLARGMGAFYATQANAFDKLRAILLGAHRLGIYADNPLFGVKPPQYGPARPSSRASSNSVGLTRCPPPAAATRRWAGPPAPHRPCIGPASRSRCIPVSLGT